MFPFIDNEIKLADTQLGQWKAPSQDSLSGNFFVENWNLVGGDIILLVKGMASGSISILDFNYSKIVLIPKGKEQPTPNDFHPINLCNSIYKIFSKVLSM